MLKVFVVMPAPGGLCHRFLLVPNFYDSLCWADVVCGLRKKVAYSMIIKGKYYVHDLECVKNLLIYTTNGLDSEAFVAQQR